MIVERSRDEKYTIQVAMEIHFLRLRSLLFLHAPVKLCYHVCLENQDLYAANKLCLFFPHKVYHGFHHGIRGCRRSGSTFT